MITETYVEGEDVTLLASMAKLKAGRLLRTAADSCLQFWGGMGFTEEVDLSKIFVCLLDLELISVNRMLCKAKGEKGD